MKVPRIESDLGHGMPPHTGHQQSNSDKLSALGLKVTIAKFLITWSTVETVQLVFDARVNNVHMIYSAEVAPSSEVVITDSTFQTVSIFTRYHNTTV